MAEQYADAITMLERGAQQLPSTSSSALVKPKTDREAVRESLQVMEPPRRDVQHLAGFQNAIYKWQAHKKRECSLIRVVQINLTGVGGQPGGEQIQPITRRRTIQTDIFGPHNLCQDIVVRIIVQRRYL
jgi:hypothetical protein